MRNNIASFAKSISSIYDYNLWKDSCKIYFCIRFCPDFNKLLLDFLKEAILFLIYLLADKGKYVCMYSYKISLSKENEDGELARWSESLFLLKYW